MKVLLIAGSIRKESYNRRIIKLAADSLETKGCAVRVANIAALPLMNEDLEVDGARPPEVEAFREDLKWAEGIVISTPEYNGSIPGVLKNAIDWGSRPPNMFASRVGAVMGATIGTWGTVQAQRDLNAVLQALNVLLVPTPFVRLARVNESFDEEGKLIDVTGRRNIDLLLDRLIDVGGKLLF